MFSACQIERQLHHARKFLPFHIEKDDERRTILTEGGTINTGIERIRGWHHQHRYREDQRLAPSTQV
jgi:hypothetical protein